MSLEVVQSATRSKIIAANFDFWWKMLSFGWNYLALRAIQQVRRIKPVWRNFVAYQSIPLQSILIECWFAFWLKHFYAIWSLCWVHVSFNTLFTSDNISIYEFSWLQVFLSVLLMFVTFCNLYKQKHCTTCTCTCTNKKIYAYRIIHRFNPSFFEPRIDLIL